MLTRRSRRKKLKGRAWKSKLRSEESEPLHPRGGDGLAKRPKPRLQLKYSERKKREHVLPLSSSLTLRLTLIGHPRAGP